MCLASCLSWDFVPADRRDLRTLSILGQAVAVVLGAPNLSFHCLLVALGYGVPFVSKPAPEVTFSSGGDI